MIIGSSNQVIRFLKFQYQVVFNLTGYKISITTVLAISNSCLITGLKLNNWPTMVWTLDLLHFERI